jgi:hypothetical protein
VRVTPSLPHYCWNDIHFDGLMAAGKTVSKIRQASEKINDSRIKEEKKTHLSLVSERLFAAAHLWKTLGSPKKRKKKNIFLVCIKCVKRRKRETFFHSISELWAI